MKLNRENVLTFLNLHLLVLILGITNIVLLTRLVLAWNTLRTDSTEQIAESRANLKTLEIQTAPLRGLPAKVDASEKQAEAFYDRRFPSNYSSISAELYDLEQKEHIRQAHLAYLPKPALPGLVEVGLDLSLAGEYAPIMRFINGLERDKMFFVINGLTLAGQQGGTVNVRLKLTTFIHAEDAERMTPPPDVNPKDTAPAETGTASASTAGGQ
jgi:type IV pilus assembly protein PilO